MFERFTDRARRVLVLAQDEARLSGHSFIGTEHMLLGLVKEGDGLAAKALEELGVSLVEVRAKVEQLSPPQKSEVRSSPPFTPRAKKVLEFSLREAHRLGHNYIGTEHILLGLLHEGEGVGAQTLKSLGIELAGAREKIEALLSGYPSYEGLRRRGDRAPDGSARPTLSPPIRSAIDAALRDAHDRGHDTARSGHLLLALLGDEDGFVARAFRRLGADLARVREEIVDHLDEE